MLSISFGQFNFSADEIRLSPYPSTVRANAPLGDRLEADIFTVTVDTDATGDRRWRDRDGVWIATSANQGIVFNYGNILDFHYGDELSVFDDGQLKAKFYITDISRSGLRSFRIESCSMIGLLTKMPHKGGIYEVVDAGDIIADIMGDLTYTIDADVAGTKVSGWLPNTDAMQGRSARDNLQQVLFATGASIVKNADGSVRFTFNAQGSAKVIPEDRTFLDNSIRETPHRATTITVVEHTYFQSSYTAEEVVYDGGTGAYVTDYTLAFDRPYHSYRFVGSGGTEIPLDPTKQGANYCTITGTGVLYAKPYVHIQRAVSQETGVNSMRRDITVNDATLVTPLNVMGVVERLANFYTHAVTKEFNMIVENEKAGDFVSYTDRYGEQQSGYVANMDETQSSFARARASVITNWTPILPSNDYDTAIIIRASDLTNGRYTVPSQYRGKRAYLALFSGAQGGQGGYAGETPLGNPPASHLFVGRSAHDLYGGEQLSYTGNYAVGTASPQQKGAAGGRGGHGGASATRILQTQIASLANSYAVSFGAGGMGGAGGYVEVDELGRCTTHEPEEGAAGAHSVWGSFDTNNGAAFQGDYLNMLTGELIATAGPSGIAGGKGGDGGRSLPQKGILKTEANAYNYASAANAWGKAGQAVGSYVGGTPGTPATGSKVAISGTDYVRFLANAGSGGGGGAAVGSNGGNGHDGSFNVSSRVYYVGKKTIDEQYNSQTGDYEYVSSTYEGPTGGDGADAVTIPSQTIYTGGAGGNGGGGGGGAAQSIGFDFRSPNNVYISGVLRGGIGGRGSAGGQGADGFGILYVKA